MTGVLPGKASPVEVLRASDRHQTVRVGEFGETADLVVFLKRSSDGHDGGGGGSTSDLKQQRRESITPRV